MIENSNFQSKHKKKAEDFTRSRKWTYPLLLLMILRKSVKSLQNRINEFASKLDKDFPTASSSSFTQARSKLLHTAFIELNRKCVVENVYSDKYKTYKGFRVLGIDGSKVLLPESEEIQDYFGLISNPNQNGGPEEYTCSLVSVMYDVLNHIAVDSIMSEGNSYEVNLAVEHTNFTMENDLLIFDRGYPSYYLLSLLTQKKIHFIARCSRGSFKEAQEMFTSQEESRIVELEPHYGQRKNIQQKSLPEKIKVRFIKVVLKSGEVEVLVTSLIDTFVPNEFKELYNLRWGSETFYDVIKNRLDLQNFSGQSVESVKQDFFATIFITGVETIITDDANQDLEYRNARNKQPLKINKAGSFNAIKNHVLELFYFEKNEDLLLEKLTTLFLSNTTSVQKHRSSTRKKSTARKRVKHYRHRRKNSF